MSMKDLWIAEHEQILEDCCSDLIAHDEALRRLIHLGFDDIEADTELERCKS